MFARLTNEVILAFALRNEGPLLINSGTSAKIRPCHDLSFIRTMHNGKETIYLPGSSIKGVFRSRYEQIMRFLEQDVCNMFDSNNTCKNKIDKEEEKTTLTGKELYDLCCVVCKLFGSLKLGGRITFSDAYPVDDDWKLGMRHGVGIDRITGASVKGALYDMEVLEDATFEIRCKLTNFKLYQLRTVLWILEDIQEGLVAFGMGTSRGYGQMRLDERREVQLIYRNYTNDEPELSGEAEDMLFGQQIRITGLPKKKKKIKIEKKKKIIKKIKKGR